MPLNRELITRWIAALRSGNYQQSWGVLRRREPTPQVGHHPGSSSTLINYTAPAGFCCLGVLCDVVDPDRWEKVPSSLTSSAAYLGEDMNEDTASTAYLPMDILELAGLDGDTCDHLVGLNDGEGGYDMDTERPIGSRTFAEIADYLEAKLNDETNQPAV